MFTLGVEEVSKKQMIVLINSVNVTVTRGWSVTKSGHFVDIIYVWFALGREVGSGT